MRIGIDGRVLRDDYPGIGRCVYNLLLAMQPQLEGDTLVVLYDPAVKSRYDISVLASLPGVELVPCVVPPQAPSQLWKLGKLLAGLRLDVFHAPYYPAACRATGTPLVLTLFDLIPMVHPASMPSAPARLAYAVAVRLAVRNARRIIVCSQAARVDLQRLLGVSAERIAVIPAAAAPVFRPSTDAAVRQTRELYRVPQRYILHVGVNKPHKNLETLLEAYHRYYTQTPAESRASLVLAGEHDPRYVTPRRWAAQLGLARSVLALGNVPDEDLRDLYTGASCVAIPSLYEGFGLPVLEAMACGAPVLCSSSSALPEVAGDAAIQLDPRDAMGWTRMIARLLEDQPLRESLRMQGLSRAAQFSWEAAARQTLEVYRAVARER
ncbi:MAG: glycosyltransferase family 4 protein [Anaerolineae bacterium]|nr:glycosyltransferase family 4 protein [Anaerolineae bacterium]